MLGWTSPVLPYLEKDGGPLGEKITSEQSSWIGSLVALGAIIGSFVAGEFGEMYVDLTRYKSPIFPVISSDNDLIVRNLTELYFRARKSESKASEQKFHFYKKIKCSLNIGDRE